MKKLYALAGLAILGLLSYNTSAQITLTSTDMPSIGTKVVNGHDTLTSSVSKLSPGSAGASVTWSYGALAKSYTDTDAFVNPSSTPYAASFSGANLADSTYGTAGYNYFNGTSGSFTVVGSEQNIMGYMVPIIFNPPILQLNFTTHYLDNSGGSTRAHIPPVSYVAAGIDSAKGTVTVTYNDTIDAWGSITTPLFGGTTYNALRQKHYEYDIDSIFVHSTLAHSWVFAQAQKTKNHQYRWYTNGISDVLMIMQMDTSNTKVKSVQWYDDLPNGINELSQQHNTLVYPNPCSNQVTFRYSIQNAQFVSVYDITGRQLGQTEMKNGTATISTSSYSNGIYLFHLTDKSGNILDNGKFTVQQ